MDHRATASAAPALSPSRTDAELVTLDRRALANYERCAVAARLLA